MLYGFAISPSISDNRPNEKFFETVARAVARAIAQPVCTPEDAINLCEYLDCADSGSFKYEKTVYAACVAMLSEYLSQSTVKAAVALASFSSAAATLLDIVNSVGLKLESQPATEFAA